MKPSVNFFIFVKFHGQFTITHCFPAYWNRLFWSISNFKLTFCSKCIEYKSYFNKIFFKFQRCTALGQFYRDKENLNMSSHLTLYIGLCLNLGLGFTHFTCLCDRSRTITICALHCVPKLMFVQNVYKCFAF